MVWIILWHPPTYPGIPLHIYVFYMYEVWLWRLAWRRHSLMSCSGCWVLQVGPQHKSNVGGEGEAGSLARIPPKNMHLPRPLRTAMERPGEKKENTTTVASPAYKVPSWLKIKPQQNGGWARQTGCSHNNIPGQMVRSAGRIHTYIHTALVSAPPPPNTHTHTHTHTHTYASHCYKHTQVPPLGECLLNTVMINLCQKKNPFSISEACPIWRLNTLSSFICL